MLNAVKFKNKQTKFYQAFCVVRQSKVKAKKKEIKLVMVWGVAFLILMVFFIVVAIFWASCCPTKCCVFDPDCCTSVCNLNCEQTAYIPFSGNTPGVGVDRLLDTPLLADEYALFTIGSSSFALGKLTDLSTDSGEAAGFSAPFTSNGYVTGLMGYVQAKADSGTAVVTLSIYRSKKSASTPSFTSILSGNFTATTTQAHGYIAPVSSAAAVSAGDLFIVLVTTSAPITLYSTGGSFIYRF